MDQILAYVIGVILTLIVSILYINYLEAKKETVLGDGGWPNLAVLFMVVGVLIIGIVSYFTN